MSDFHQNGLVTVLHRLGDPNLEQLEKELERHAASNPIALVLPSLYSELENPALKHIVQVLKDIRYVNEIVISLDRASALEFRLAKQFFPCCRRGCESFGTTGPGFRTSSNFWPMRNSTPDCREKAGAAGWLSDMSWPVEKAT